MTEENHVTVERTNPCAVGIHSCGRIGNYFFTSGWLENCPSAAPPRHYRFKGCAEPVAAEESHEFASGPDACKRRFIDFFWVNDGYRIEITREYPLAAGLMDGEGAVTPAEVRVHELSSRPFEDLLECIKAANHPVLWVSRMALEIVSLCPSGERDAYHAAALAHQDWSVLHAAFTGRGGWPGGEPGALQSLRFISDCVTAMQPEDLPSGLRDSFVKIADSCSGLMDDAETACRLISLLSGVDRQSAARFASQVMLRMELGREELADYLRPHYPRDSQWWIWSVVRNRDLGPEQVADALNTAGVAAGSCGSNRVAELSYSAALKVDPSCQSAAWNLGWLRTANGRLDEAKQVFKTLGRYYVNSALSSAWPTFGGIPWPFARFDPVPAALPPGCDEWPRISVVTPSYNQGCYIEETILSVLHQSYPNLQYIIVDGGSTDSTRDVLEKYRERIDHLIIEPDDGQTAAINKGLRLADGEIVAWLNSDDMYAPGALHQAALQWLSSRADVVAGICAEHSGRNLRLINKPSASNRDFNTAQLARIFPYWFSGTYFFQPEVFFTRSILERVGLLDESLHYAMDYDLWMRFAKAGARLSVVDWPCAFFRIHEAQKTSRAMECIKEQCAVRNRHHPLALLEERQHQLARQLASLLTNADPCFALFGSGFESGICGEAPGSARILRSASVDDPSLASAAAAVVRIGSHRRELPLLRQLRAAHPELLLIGWFPDHDRDPHANFDAACLVDVILPADAETGDYLRNDFAMITAAVPPGRLAAFLEDPGSWLAPGGGVTV